jgi:hypothetical protein
MRRDRSFQPSSLRLTETLLPRLCSMPCGASALIRVKSPGVSSMQCMMLSASGRPAGRTPHRYLPVVTAFFVADSFGLLMGGRIGLL